MFNWLMDKLYEIDPNSACYLAIFLILLLITARLAMFYSETEQKNKEVDNIGNILERLDKGFTTLNQVLLEKDVIKSSCYSVGNSPRILNQAGVELYSKSGASKIFDRIKEELITDLDKKEFDSLLELERQSLNVLIEKMDDKRFKDIQNFAFRNPNFNGHPLGYTDILFMMALKLRDLYIDKHPDSNLG
jgi:hypothetical protein